MKCENLRTFAFFSAFFSVVFAHRVSVFGEGGPKPRASPKACSTFFLEELSALPWSYPLYSADIESLLPLRAFAPKRSPQQNIRLQFQFIGNRAVTVLRV